MDLKKPPVPLPLLAGLLSALLVGGFGIGYLALVDDSDSTTTDDGGREITASDLPPTSWRPTVPPVERLPSESGASSRPLVEDRQAPSAVRGLEAGCGEPVTVTAPATDLAQQVAAAEPGTCFVLEPGEYRFRDVEPKDYMTFLGTSRDEVVVQGDGSTENAFHGTAVGVTIGQMRLLGFSGNGGEGKAQEQAPIRGTAAIWESDRGAMASEWLIEDIEASGNYANGVFLGDNFTIRASLFTDNGVTGLGGSEIVGGLIEGNVIRDNGAAAADGVYANGGGIKLTEAIAGDAPVTVQLNEIYGNHDIGVWCDIACDGFHVLDNYIHDQESRAVMYELSRNAVIRNNVLINANSWTDYRRDFNAGAITVGESSDVTVENNYIDGAESGVIIRQTRRPASGEGFLNDYPNVNFRAGAVEVLNNVLVNTASMGVSLGTTGRDAGPDLGSIVFEGNSYGDPGGVAFWWDGGAVDFGTWQEAGRDTRSAPVTGGTPTWVGFQS